MAGATQNEAQNGYPRCPSLWKSVRSYSRDGLRRNLERRPSNSSSSFSVGSLCDNGGYLATQSLHSEPIEDLNLNGGDHILGTFGITSDNICHIKSSMSLVNHTCQKSANKGCPLSPPFPPCKTSCGFRMRLSRRLGLWESLTPEEAARLVGDERLR
jgi:hypothetical protein